MLTAADVLLILLLQARGFRWLEAFIITLVVVIFLCFAFEMVLSAPAVSGVLGGLLPSPEIVTNPAMLYIAIGILGATVMPHNLYLHSSIVQTRSYELSEPVKREAIRLATIDSTLALTIALLINSAILILAAAAFHEAGALGGRRDPGRLSSARAAAWACRSPARCSPIALLASGQNSTITATLAGQIVMEGFLDIRLPPWLRRLATRLLAIVPAVVVTALYGASGTAQLLILSQVILSLQLPFAVVPLVQFTSDRTKMGAFVKPPLGGRARLGRRGPDHRAQRQAAVRCRRRPQSASACRTPAGGARRRDGLDR